MIHKDIDVLLGHLTTNGVDQELKSELMYMRTIFKFQHFVFSGYLGFLGDTVTARMFEERLFYSPSCRTSKECMVNYVDSLVSFIIQKARPTSFHPDASTGAASKFLESLLKNLQSIKKATRRCLSTSTLVPSEILEEKLRALMDSPHFKASTAQQEDLLTRIQALADSAADLCFAFWVKMSDHFLDTDEISHLLYLRNICKERVPPLEIKVASQMVLLDVCKRLDLVKGLLMNFPKQYLMQDKIKDLLRQIAALTSKTRYCSPEKDMAVSVDDELGILLEKSKEICLDVRKPLHSCFPLTDDWGMIDSLVMSLNKRLGFKADSLNIVKREVEKVKTIIEQGKKCDSLDDLRQRVFQIAYEADYVIDSMNLNNDPPPYLRSYLSDIIKEANFIHKEIFDSVVKSGKGVKFSNPQSSLVSTLGESNLRHLKELDILPSVSMTGLGKRTLSSLVNTPIDDNVLGFKEEEAIKNQLLNKLGKLDVISIVGVSGLGKTTLANKIYNDESVINHFKVRAWCCVSQEYNKTKLLCEIYSQVTEDECQTKPDTKAKVTELDLAEQLSKCVIDKKTRSKVAETDVAEKLHKFLKENGYPYLIVLDDIRESRAYDEIIRCFPTEENGSRIMLTTRFNEVAHTIKLHSNPHLLPFFSEEDSWKLLQWKVFRNEKCNPELLKIGKEISESCRGLPLFLVLVAGLLTSINKEERLWSEVAKSLSLITSEHDVHMHLLLLIYKHLPGRLKSCFLFFAAFPEDQEIAVSKLVQLWAAEGFVEKIEGKSLEDVAEDYLSDLLSGGLIAVSKRRYDGSIISCRVHSIIHEFCSKMANTEHFLTISSTDNQIPTWDLACHRICFNNQDIDCHNPLDHLNPSVRTIVCTSRRQDPQFSKAIDFSQISHRSRLIRVLDLESITVGNTLFSVIEHLPHLRFIAVHTGYFNFVLPSSLGNLHNLETLKIKTENQCMVPPKTISNMAKLRQLDISDSFQFGIDEDDSCLNNIEAISTVLLPSNESIGVMIRFPFLRRLKCIYIGSNEASPESNECLELENLDQLESLHVSYDGPLEKRDLIVLKFPWSLKQLTLNGFSLPAREISQIALIPTLVALKLQNVHFKDLKWDVEEYDYPRLNYLKLHNCSIVYWSALNSSFPRLERLIVRRCMILKEVPFCFGNIATLEAVEVDRCNRSLAGSVLKIQNEANKISSRLVIRILKSDFNPQICK